MPDYLIRYIQDHETFRQPEIEAIADLYAAEIVFLRYQHESPFAIIRLASDEIARRIISRSVSSRGIYELWAEAKDYATLHERIKQQTQPQWEKFMKCSFRLEIDSFRGSRSSTAQRELIESFSYLGFQGPIRMKNPDETFCIFEEYRDMQSDQSMNDDTTTPSRVFFGRYLESSQRHILAQYSLKTRSYINTTSMDAELALLTGNIAQAGPGKIFYDPFVGTGGFPVACAHFGAMTLGSDIDGRTMRGREKDKNIKSNFRQYEISHLWLGGFAADLTHAPFSRRRRWLDGVVCDPPYGIREGLKVLGMKDDAAGNPRGREITYVNGLPSHLQDSYVAPKKAYSLDAMLQDILSFAANVLVDNARLALWMPTANDAEEQLSIPHHEALELVTCSTQMFTKWSRRLLTYRRVPGEFAASSKDHAVTSIPHGSSANDLNNFRKRYFEGFRTITQPEVS